MAELDLPTLSQTVLKLRLASESQVLECIEAVGSRTGDVTEFVRVLERKGYVTPWQTSKLLKGDLTGYMLGGYRLLYKIASGTFGRVYRAEDPTTGNVVAVKALRRRFSEDAHQIQLFEREGQIGLSLRHPNIVPILAIQQDPITKQYYIVMEFVEGGNLRDFIAIRKKLQAPEAMRLLEDAAAGLAYAYERNVTHRDIKPTNILISTQKSAKLVDFGLFKFSRVGLEIEEDRKVDRTVDYAGLEKAAGVKSGDTRSDVYFLGCCVYQMLTGRSPLAMSRNPHERMRKSRFDEVKSMGRDEVDAPQAVFHLVETMMALDPLRRYQNPSQLLDAVKDVRRRLEAPKSGPGALPETRKVFVIEKHETALNAIRERLKKLGYRVLLSTDPTIVIERYRTSPFDALVVNVGSAGEDGLTALQNVLQEAKRQGRDCPAIVVLGDDQADWSTRVPESPDVAVLSRPVTLKQLQEKLTELAPLAGASEVKGQKSEVRGQKSEVGQEGTDL
jgi:serine/threonine protein kinase